MRKAPKADLIRIGIDDPRLLLDATYYVYDGDVERPGEYSRDELHQWLHGRVHHENLVNREDTLISAVHNFRGIRINPVSGEWRGGLVKHPYYVEPIKPDTILVDGHPVYGVLI